MMAVSVHVSTFPSLLFEPCDNSSTESNNSMNTFDFSSYNDNTTLFDWSDIPCHDETVLSNSIYYSIDDHVENDPYSQLSSHCDMFSMDDCYRPRRVQELSKSQPIDRFEEDVLPVLPVQVECTKTLHGRSSTSTSSIDKISDITVVPKKKLRTKTTSVTFSNCIAVREYNIVPAIHPCCIFGLAIELGWNYTDNQQQQQVVDTSTKLTSTSTSTTSSRRNSRYNNNNKNKSMNYLRLNYFERRERLERMTGKSELQMLRELHHDEL